MSDMEDAGDDDGEFRLRQPEEPEEEPEVVFDDPMVFNISLNFKGVSDRPDEITAVVDAVIEEARGRGLFYDGHGFVQLDETDNFEPRTGSELHQALTGLPPRPDEQ